MVVEPFGDDIVGDSETRRLAPEEQADLVERFDVVGHEGDRYNEHLLLAGLRELREDFGRRRSEPFHRADLRLIAEARAVPALERRVEDPDGFLDVARVRVFLSLDRFHRQRMRGIEHDGPRGIRVRQRGGRGENAGDVRGDEAGLLVPRVGRVPPLRRPAHPREGVRDPVERAARRRDGVLGIERQDEEARGAGRPQLLEGGLDERGRTRHTDADGGRRGAGHCGHRSRGEKLFQEACLRLGPAADRRPSDALVDLGRLRHAGRRDRPGDELAEGRERNAEDLGVHEELVQEGFQLLAALRPSELDEEDAEPAREAHSVLENIFGAVGAFFSKYSSKSMATFRMKIRPSVVTRISSGVSATIPSRTNSGSRATAEANVSSNEESPQARSISRLSMTQWQRSRVMTSRLRKSADVNRWPLTVEKRASSIARW